jgi:hypothetical protein
MSERATLAEYAIVRERLAAKIETANQKLADAIAMRKDYRTAVIDSVKAFGSLLTAQASTIDGVEQALTYGDITSNLQDRLAKIREFQSDLRKLMALGVSDAVYKQLVDAGVEEGGKFADALLQGGVGAVQEVNDLTAQIDSVAQSLGKEAADRLYQSGISAARGIVDGLESQSKELERWAKWLGKTVSQSIENAIAGHRPGNGGGGKGNGGGGKGGGRDRVGVSREVAAYAARQGQDPTVSGNGFRDLIVNTPTENPEAVAMEVLNEVTGRL